jgi:hypothetical protein
VDFLTDRRAMIRERCALQQANISFDAEALNQLTEGRQ